MLSGLSLSHTKQNNTLTRYCTAWARNARFMGNLQWLQSPKTDISDHLFNDANIGNMFFSPQKVNQKIPDQTGVPDYVCMHTWIRKWIPTESQMNPKWIPTESQMNPKWTPTESQMNPKKLAESWILNPKTSNKSLLNPESWIPKPQTNHTESLNPNWILNPHWILNP